MSPEPRTWEQVIRAELTEADFTVNPPDTLLWSTRRRRRVLLRRARSWLGVPYVWGGTTKKGVDCSGLVQSVYRTLGIELPRVSYVQALVGEYVEMHELEPGDLCFYAFDEAREQVSHVGIYVGRSTAGQRILLHASGLEKYMKVIEREDFIPDSYFTHGRRVL